MSTSLAERDLVARPLDQITLGRRRLIVNAGWLLLNCLATAAATGVIALLLTRYLGPVSYGRLMFATSFVTLFVPLVHLGLETVVIRDIVDEPRLAARLLHTALGLQAIGAGVALALSITIGAIIARDDSAMWLLIAVAAVSLLPRAMQVLVYWFQARAESEQALVARVAGLTSGALVRVGMIVFEAPLLLFAVVLTVEAAVEGAVLVWRYRRKKTEATGPITFQAALAMRMLSESWPLWISGIAVVIYMHIDQVMLRLMLGAEGDYAVGIYAPAVQIMAFVFSIGVALATAAFPPLISVRVRDPERYARRLQQTFDALTWSAIVVVLPLSLVSAPVARLLLGSQFAPTAEVLSLLAWTAPFVWQGVLQGRWLTIERLQHLGQVWAIGACVGNILLNVLLIPRYGATGAAIATLVTQCSTTLLGPLLFRDTRRMAIVPVLALAAPLRYASALWRRR